MQISSVTSPSALTSASDATATVATRTAKKVLGQEDFVKLLSVQFQSQDPLKPMDDTAFIAQMAQFTSLQQSSDLVTSVGQLRADQQRLAAVTYIGKNVTLDAGAGDGTTVTGDVAAVDTSGASPQILVNGRSYPLSALLSVQAATPAPSPTPSNPQPAS